MSLFVVRFKELLEQSGKMQNDICKDLGISKQKLSKWKTGYTEPNLDDIILLATYFDVTADYLIGLTTTASGQVIKDSFNITGNGNSINFRNH